MILQFQSKVGFGQCTSNSSRKSHWKCSWRHWSHQTWPQCQPDHLRSPHVQVSSLRLLPFSSVFCPTSIGFSRMLPIQYLMPRGPKVICCPCWGEKKLLKNWVGFFKATFTDFGSTNPQCPRWFHGHPKLHVSLWKTSFWHDLPSSLDSRIPSQLRTKSRLQKRTKSAKSDQQCNSQQRTNPNGSCVRNKQSIVSHFLTRLDKWYLGLNDTIQYHLIHH